MNKAYDRNAAVSAEQPAEQVQEQPGDGGVGVLSASSQEQQGGAEIPQEKKNAIESAQNTILKMVYSKETMPDVLRMLKSGEPSQTIPNTANMIFKKLEQSSDNKIPGDIKLAAATSLVMELTEIGNEGQVFQISEKQMQPILQNTYRIYIENGLKDGTIDPIELQKSVNPMMKGNAKGYGEEVAQKEGMPMEPTQDMAIQKGTQDKLRPIQQENAKLKGLLQTQGGM